MKETVKDAFEVILLDRAHTEAFRNAQKDPEYYNARTAADGVFHLLSEALTTEEQKTLLDKLESAWNYADSILLDYVYRQGLKDSDMLDMELSKYGLSVKKENKTR